MIEAVSEPQARPRAYLGGVTLLLALTLSVRVLDAAYTLPVFRPMVAQAVVRLLAGSDLTDHRPALSARALHMQVPRPDARVATDRESLVAGPVGALRAELSDLPPPAPSRA